MQKVNGAYVPSFFSMDVNTDKSLDEDGIKLLNDEEISSFFHEYVHFIQNISTLVGIRDIGIDIELIMNAHNEEKLRLKEDKNKYTGDKIKSHTIQITKISESDNTVYVNYKDANSIEKTLKFGSYCIMESMAYLGQSLLFPPKDKRDDIPYHIALKITDYIYPEIASNQLFVFSLCDASMMTLNPGFSFFQSLNEMKKSKIVFQNANEVFDFVLNTNKTENLLERSSQLREFIKQTFNFIEIGKPNEEIELVFNTIKWVDTLISNATIYRENNPYFLLDFVRNENTNYLLDELINTLGYPICFNNKSNASFKKPQICDYEVNPQYWLVIKEFKNTAENAKCEMLEWCNTSSIPDLVNLDCACPRKRSFSERDSLCPFDVMWNLCLILSKLREGK